MVNPEIRRKALRVHGNLLPRQWDAKTSRSFNVKHETHARLEGPIDHCWTEIHPFVRTIAFRLNPSDNFRVASPQPAHRSETRLKREPDVRERQINLFHVRDEVGAARLDRLDIHADDFAHVVSDS